MTDNDPGAKIDAMHSTDRLPRFTDLTLVLTERCNLHCSYCYVPKRSGTMSAEVAKMAVDLLAERAAPDAPLSMGFFGGEPFLARELMADVMAYGRQRCGDRLRFSAPTNGTLVDERARRLASRYGLRLALSVDRAGVDLPDDPEQEHTLERLQDRIGELRGLSPILRMTVTPQNVGFLFESIVRLHGEGLSQIMHQPALEEPWPAAAVETWAAQHQMIVDWCCERYARRQTLPTLTVLEGILGRLGGKGAAYCGAGVRTAAVDPQGRIFGCYRSAYDPRAERLVLGDLRGGEVNETLVAAYARLHPNRARPQGDHCESCDARAGCTAYCAAMGHVLLGDLRGVPADACTLMRIQVAACRDAARRMGRNDRDWRRKVGGQVAAAALALSLAGGSASCDSDRVVVSDGSMPGVCAADMQTDGVVPGLCDWPGPDLRVDIPPPGLCDTGWTDLGPDMIGPGLCPWVEPDAGPTKLDATVPVPGICPVILPDGGSTKFDAAVPVPGLCAIPPPDGGFAKFDATVPVPGVCPVILPDAGPNKPDAAVPVPGVCPVIMPDGGSNKPDS